MDYNLNYNDTPIKAKKRNEILNKSINIFIREGIGKLKMRDIAKECNISLRSLYYYYSNKEDLAIDVQIKCMSSFTNMVNNISITEKVDYNQFCEYLDNMYNIIIEKEKEIKFITAFDYYFYNSYPNEKYSTFLKTALTDNFIFKKEYIIDFESINFHGEDPNTFLITIIQSFLAYAQKIIYREKAMLSENIKSKGELRIFVKIIKEAIKL